MTGSHVDSYTSLCTGRKPNDSDRETYSHDDISRVYKINSDTSNMKERQFTAVLTKSQVELDSNNELKHIKDSVQRLRVQRTHVEHLQQTNERLEALVAERTQENELLRRETESLRGVSVENKGLLQSFKLLEERIRHLEVECEEQKARAQHAQEQALRIEQDRDELQLQVDQLCVADERRRTQLENEQAANQYQIDTLVKKHEKQCEKLKHQVQEWHQQVEAIKEDQAQMENQHQGDLRRLQEQNTQLNRDRTSLETQIQTLLETTMRQTTMIEECDRALSEARARHDKANASYHDQLQLHLQLQAKIKALETQLTSTTTSIEVEKRHVEKQMLEMETRVQRYKDKIDLYRVALLEKENKIEAFEKDILVRDQNRQQVETMVKELRKREKTLLSEIAELKIALTDMADEKNIHENEKKMLKEQLEKERNDRTRWAAARLELLAEFCDEESKLTALQLPSTLDRWISDDENEENEEDDDEDIARLIRDSKAPSRRKPEKLPRKSRKKGKVRDPTLVFG